MYWVHEKYNFMKNLKIHIKKSYIWKIFLFASTWSKGHWIFFLSYIENYSTSHWKRVLTCHSEMLYVSYESQIDSESDQNNTKLWIYFTVKDVQHDHQRRILGKWGMLLLCLLPWIKHMEINDTDCPSNYIFQLNQSILAALVHKRL